MNNLSGSLSFNGNVSGQMGANLIPSVEANPSGTATEILTSIRVGDIIYSIPSGGGGGGGTNDYNSLLNKPKINNVILSGELSLTDLGIQAKINFPNDNSKYLDGEGNFTTPAYFSGDYDDLTDKPQINSVTLEGNKTASDLKLISEMHTASGDEAAIETDDTLPLLSCISDINPVQDLHGYSKPWAGGAGKNKYIGSPSFDGYMNKSYWSLDSEEYNTHEVYKRNLAWSGMYKEIPLALGTYTFSIMAKADSSSSCALFLTNNNTTATVTNGTSFTTIGTEWGVVSVTFEVTTAGTVAPRIERTDANGYLYISEYQLEIGSQATAYEPYSNICPISGHTDVTVTVASTSGGSGEDTTVSLGRTVYGGTLDVVSGKLTVTWDNIASYAGETLTGEWLSSLDEYDALSTPTIGAQVAYELATPQTFNLTKEQIVTILGDNYIRSDTGDIEITYVTNVIDPLLKYLLENR